MHRSDAIKSSFTLFYETHYVSPIYALCSRSKNVLLQQQITWLIFSEDRETIKTDLPRHARALQTLFDRLDLSCSNSIFTRLETSQPPLYSLYLLVCCQPVAHGRNFHPAAPVAHKFITELHTRKRTPYNSKESD